MKPPVFNKIKTNVDKDVPKTKVESGHILTTDLIISVVPDQSMYFKLSNDSIEVITSIIYDILYTDPGYLPYSREGGVGIDNFIFRLNEPEVQNEIIQKLSEEFARNTHFNLISAKVIEISRNEYKLECVIEYAGFQVPVSIPLKTTDLILNQNQ